MNHKLESRLPGDPGGGNGNPLQYSCLENPMDGGAWCRLLSMRSQRRKKKNIARRNINNLRYADDATVMAESEEELRRAS